MGAKRTALNLTGKRSGMLVAIKDVGKDSKGSRLWLCECDCGGTRVVVSGHFRKINNCGCRRYIRDEEEALKKFDRKSIELKPGRTYEEFILLENQDVEYTYICQYLGIGFFEAREIFDKISHLCIDDIGTIKRKNLTSGRVRG